MLSTRRQSRATSRGKVLPWTKLPQTRSSSLVPNETRAVVVALPDVRGPWTVDPNVILSSGVGPLVKALGPVSAAGVTPIKAQPIFRLSILGQASYGKLAELFESAVFIELLDLIRQRHNVLIERSRVLPGSLAVCGGSLMAIHATRTSICDLLHHCMQASLHESFMVQLVDSLDREVVLTANDTINPGWARFSFAETPLDARPKLKKEEIRSLLQAQAVILRSHLDAAAQKLKTSPATLHMRVQLGRVLLRTMNGRSSISGGMKTFFARSPVEGDIVFDHRIDNKDRFEVFQRAILDSRDHFYPCSSTTAELYHVQPQKFLVVITNAFRVELEIGAPGSAPNGRSAKLSHLRLFQLHGVEGRVQMATSCPSHCVDWRLMIVPELSNMEAPRSIKSILDNLAVVYPTEEADFPDVIVQPGMIQAHKVKQLFGKKTWSVGCKGTRYTMELEMQHRFSNLELPETQLESTAISLWNSAWGEVLKAPPVAGSVRDFGTNWDKLFVPTSHGDGVVDFLKMVRWALRFADSSFSRRKVFSVQKGTLPSSSTQVSHATESTGSAEPTDMSCRTTSAKPTKVTSATKTTTMPKTTATTTTTTSMPANLTESLNELTNSANPARTLFALDLEGACVRDTLAMSNTVQAEEDLIIFD